MKLFYLIILSSFLLFGCGNGDDSLAKKAGNKVGESLTDFAKGMGKGIDEKMNVQVELSSSLVGKGISSTVSKLDGLGNKSLSVYLIASKPYTGKIISKAYNAQGLEIGRATADVELIANDAKYYIFAFHKEMDTQLVTKYTLDTL